MARSGVGAMGSETMSSPDSDLMGQGKFWEVGMGHPFQVDTYLISVLLLWLYGFIMRLRLEHQHKPAGRPSNLANYYRLFALVAV